MQALKKSRIELNGDFEPHFEEVAEVFDRQQELGTVVAHHRGVLVFAGDTRHREDYFNPIYVIRI
jgi:hypothetical protein